MGNLFSVNFWVQAFASAVVTMICFYVIKKVTSKVDIPVVSDIANNA